MRRGGPANADFDKVLAKEPGAENGVVVATPSHGARTSTSAQVLAEHRQINVARHCPLPSHDMAEVRCRPQISHGRAGAIPLPLERGCETVKVWSAWPAPQMPQHLRCREVGLQHASSPFVTGHRWPSRRRRRTALLWRAGALRFTEKCRSRHANSPLLDLPIRQVMGDAHYLPQPALPEVPGRGGAAMARRARGRAAAGPLLPRRLHPAGGDRRHRVPEQGRRLRPPVQDRRRDADSRSPPTRSIWARASASPPCSTPGARR